LPRVVEVFERRTPRNPAVVAMKDGKVTDIIMNEEKRVIIVTSDKKETEYPLSYRRVSLVKVGQDVKAGDILTDGSAIVTDIFKHGNEKMAQEYIINEINKVYELQGAATSGKHIEIIVRQMFSRRQIKDPGDTLFATGDIVETIELVEENEKTKKLGGKPAVGQMVVLGITEVSLTTKSWLSAASFQNTNRILIQNAVRGGQDRLRGLKENVIVGRLIPAGTGFKKKEGKK